MSMPLKPETVRRRFHALKDREREVSSKYFYELREIRRDRQALQEACRHPDACVVRHAGMPHLYECADCGKRWLAPLGKE